MLGIMFSPVVKGLLQPITSRCGRQFRTVTNKVSSKRSLGVCSKTLMWTNDTCGPIRTLLTVDPEADPYMMITVCVCVREIKVKEDITAMWLWVFFSCPAVLFVSFCRCVKSSTASGENSWRNPWQQEEKMPCKVLERLQPRVVQQKGLGQGWVEWRGFYCFFGRP